jgi:hypothetical protein
MIPAGVQVYVASTPVDFRKGATDLTALVRDGGANPFSGALYAFRSKRAQHATFCIQSSQRDNCISVASPFGVGRQRHGAGDEVVAPGTLHLAADPRRRGACQRNATRDATRRTRLDACFTEGCEAATLSAERSLEPVACRCIF